MWRSQWNRQIADLSIPRVQHLTSIVAQVLRIADSGADLVRLTVQVRDCT
jgi:4-hydroxy-3-methylbut-2-en-1-yl diphosphate synthase IspG/GcpE